MLDIIFYNDTFEADLIHQFGAPCIGPENFFDEWFFENLYTENLGMKNHEKWMYTWTPWIKYYWSKNFCPGIYRGHFSQEYRKSLHFFLYTNWRLLQAVDNGLDYFMKVYNYDQVRIYDQLLITKFHNFWELLFNVHSYAERYYFNSSKNLYLYPHYSVFDFKNNRSYGDYMYHDNLDSKKWTYYNALVYAKTFFGKKIEQVGWLGFNTSSLDFFNLFRCKNPGDFNIYTSFFKFKPYTQNSKLLPGGWIYFDNPTNFQCDQYLIRSFVELQSYFFNNKYWDLFKKSNWIYDSSVSNPNFYKLGSNSKRFLESIDLVIEKKPVSFFDYFKIKHKPNFKEKTDSIIYSFYEEFDWDIVENKYFLKDNEKLKIKFDYFGKYKTYTGLENIDFYFQFMATLKISQKFVWLKVYSYFYINLFILFCSLYNIYIIKVNEAKVKYIFFFFKYYLELVLCKLNRKLSLFLLFINYKFKIKIKFIKINKDYLFCSPENFQNFDLILFVYYKFISKYFNFKSNLNFLKSESHFMFFKEKEKLRLTDKNDPYPYKNFLFLILNFVFIGFVFLGLCLNIMNIYFFMIFDASLNLKRNKKFRLIIPIKGFEITKIVFYTNKYLFSFLRHLLCYRMFFHLVNFISKSKKISDEILVSKIYIYLSDLTFHKIWSLRGKLIFMEKKYDRYMRVKTFFLRKTNNKLLWFVEELGKGVVDWNLSRFFGSIEGSISNFFKKLFIFDSSLFSASRIITFDYSFLEFFEKKLGDDLRTKIFINIEFELYIFKPLSIFFKKYIFRNILVVLFFCSKFLNYEKFEIYLKFFFFYLLNIILLCFCFSKKNLKCILNLKYIYLIYRKVVKIKYVILVVYEYLLNKIIILFYYRFKGLKLFILFLFIIFYVLNLNSLEFLHLIYYLLSKEIFIYIYWGFFEFFLFSFESLIIDQILVKAYSFDNLFQVNNRSLLYSLNYKEYCDAWERLLMDLYISADSFSTRQAYGVSSRISRGKDPEGFATVYASIPSNTVHGIIRLLIYLNDNDPNFWFYCIRYWDRFFRLEWNALGIKIAIENKYSVYLINLLTQGFYINSLYAWSLAGSDLNNLSLMSACSSYENFFLQKLVLYMGYNFMKCYFIFEFLFCKLLNYIFFLGGLLVIEFRSEWILIFKYILWLSYVLFYVFQYIYYYFFDSLMDRVYIVFYSLFFVNLFLNFFLFTFNLFFYYQETFYGFLNMDIDFIRQNVFNFKYKLVNPFIHPMHMKYNNVLGFEQSRWIDNQFKEHFLRDLFFYELKNSHFFKTFYNFDKNVNRINFLILLIYYYIIFRWSQYVLSWVNKWFFFTFFNNDWSVSKIPFLTWKKWTIFKKKNSYYFNDCFDSSLITPYFKYSDIDFDTFVYQQTNYFLNNDSKKSIELGFRIKADEKKRKEEMKKKKKKIERKIYDYNNNLFFQNQHELARGLWKRHSLNSKFFNWQTLSLIFFKNYQFLWYKQKQPDSMLISYGFVYGNYNRKLIEKHSKNVLVNLNIDKYNYVFLPPKARIAYRDHLTKELIFYTEFVSKNLYAENNYNHNWRNYPENKWFLYDVNWNDLYYNRLQYPFLMFFFDSQDKYTQNLKYLFPFLIENKKIRNIYRAILEVSKKNVEKESALILVGKGVKEFNKSPVLTSLGIFSNLRFDWSYDDFNYRGIWDNPGEEGSDLFYNYRGWLKSFDTSPNYDYLVFYEQFEKILKFESDFQDYLMFVSKRYFAHRVPVVKTGNWLDMPIVRESKITIDEEYHNHNLNLDIEKITDWKSSFYGKDKDSWLELYTAFLKEGYWEKRSEEIAGYSLNDEVPILLSHQNYQLKDFVGKINYVTVFIYIFIPLYVYVVGSETVFIMSRGFAYGVDIEMPVKPKHLKSFEYYLTFADCEMKNESYVYINVVQQELVDWSWRLYNEIFYKFTKYFSFFDYENSVKKNHFIFHDDSLTNREKTYKMRLPKGKPWLRHRLKRAFQSFFIYDALENNYMEERYNRFNFAGRKLYYVFPDLSYNLPSFYYNYGDNLFNIISTYGYLKKHLVAFKYDNRILPGTYELLKSQCSFSENELDFYKKIHGNKNEFLNYLFFFFKKIDTQNFLMFNEANYFKKFYSYLNNRNRVFVFWYDPYFNLDDEFMEFVYFEENSNTTASYVQSKNILSYFDFSNRYPNGKRRIVKLELEIYKGIKRMIEEYYKNKEIKYYTKHTVPWSNGGSYYFIGRRKGEYYNITKTPWILFKHAPVKSLFKWWDYFELFSTNVLVKTEESKLFDLYTQNCFMPDDSFGSTYPYYKKVTDDYVFKRRKYYPFWMYERERNPFERRFLFRYVDFNWLKRVKFKPITSYYLKGFDVNYILFNDYFLNNFQKFYNSFIKAQHLYLDKSTFLHEGEKVWQFKMSLNDQRGFFSVKFFEFFYYFFIILLLSLFICFFILLFFSYYYFFSYLYIIDVKKKNEFFYDKKRKKWLFLKK